MNRIKITFTSEVHYKGTVQGVGYGGEVILPEEKANSFLRKIVVHCRIRGFAHLKVQTTLLKPNSKQLKLSFK